MFPSPFIFANLSKVVVGTSIGDQAHTQRILMIKFFIFVSMALVIVARYCIVLSRQASLHVLLPTRGVLIPVPQRVCRCIEDTKFFEVIRGTFTDPVLLYLVFRRSQEAN